MSGRTKPKHFPLSCTVTRDGRLRIEIGIEVLAFATPQAWEEHRHVGVAVDAVARPEERFSITDARGFAIDVRRELLAEREDGSSLLTGLFDGAAVRAIEEGSEFFVDKQEGAAR
jgi:hypothetical protein